MMSRWLKRLLAGGLVFLLLMAGALGVLIATIDQQAYKTWLQDQVQLRYGRTLDIKGDIGLSVFPDLGLRATNLVLSEPDSKTLFASVNEVNVSVSIKPLFQRKLAIKQVSLDGLDIKLIRDQQGKWNVKDLTSPKGIGSQTTGAPSQGAGQTAAMVIDLHRLEVKRASMTVFDQDKPWMTVNNLTANLATTSGGRDYDVSVSASLDVLREGQGDVSARSRISVDEDFSRLTAKGSEIKLTRVRQHDGRGLRQVDMTLTMDSLMTERSSSVVSVSSLAFRAKGLASDDRFEWVADIPSFQVGRSSAAVPALSGRLRVDGANALDAKYQVSGLSFKPDLIDIRQIKLDVGLKQINRFSKLEAEMPVTVRAGKTIHAAAARGTLHVVDLSLPPGGVTLPFNGDLEYDLGKKQASWKLSTSFLNSTIQLSGSAAGLDKSVASVSASLDADVLDLNAVDAFLNQPKSSAKTGQSVVQSKPDAAVARSDEAEVTSVQSSSVNKASPSNWQPTVTPPPAMDVSWMRSFNLDLQVRASRFVWKDLHANQLRFQLNIGQGKAELRSLQASLYGGSLNAEGGLNDSKGLPAYLKGKFSAVQVEPLMTALIGESMLGGIGNMSFDLKSSAIDSRSLLNNLDGQSQIDIKQGFIRGLDLDKGVDALSEPSGRADDMPLAMDQSKRTNFSVMQTQVLFGQGLARLYKLNLSSNNIRITEGKVAQIGLLDGSLNIVTEVQFTGNIGLPGARVAIQVRSLMVPLHIGGTLQAPQVRVHWQSMPEGALKQSLQQLLMQGVIGGSGGFVGVGTTSPSTSTDSGSKASPNPATQLENVIRGLFRK